MTYEKIASAAMTEILACACTSYDDDNFTCVHPDNGGSSSSEPPPMQPRALQTTTDGDGDDGVATAKQRSSPTVTPPRTAQNQLKTHYRPPPAPCKRRVDHACSKHDSIAIPTRQQPDSGDIDEDGVTATTVAARSGHSS
ncbi:hypothetical protein EDB85DRAFT_1894411 [Lactarius pseudohatsudake]|nr:hypothetical protein EDB85DRAFT_1894411 [Lactarius pseudohatsudake]